MRRCVTIAAGLALLVALFAGCATAPETGDTAGGTATASDTTTAQDTATTQDTATDGGAEARAETADAMDDVDATSGPTWWIPLAGIRDHDLQTYEVRQLMVEEGKEVEITVDERGEEVDYSGVLLTDIIAFVDGAEFEDPWDFDLDRWQSGYDVTVTAADGYAATFSTLEMDPEALVFAMTRNGEYTHPRIVGDAPRSMWVRDIASIELVIESDEAEARRAAFELVISANDEEYRYSIADLEDSPFYAQGRGQYTTAAGTVYAAEYGGVILRGFLEQYVALSPESSITLVAMDGYEMTFGGAELFDEEDGRWLLAFEEDGAPLPVDPGYIRVVKIGPDQPNIPGHLAVKMVAEVQVSGRAFQDFSLSMEGPLSMDLDRSTLQSQMAFYGRTVTFTRRGETAEYTGIPVYRLLAFADDPDYLPHGQDFEIDPYNSEAALAGYTIDFVATDGFTVTLDSREVHENDDVILALRKEGEELPEAEWPLILVWDVEADPVPEGIRNVRNIQTIRLNLDE